MKWLALLKAFALRFRVWLVSTDLPESVRQLAQGTAPDEALGACVATGSGVDVGSWFGKRRLYVFVLRGRLLLVAAGPRPYVDTVPFEALGGSIYNHVTGELILAPVDYTRVNRLKLTPLDGRAILINILKQ